jgi:hypothetical protein
LLFCWAKAKKSKHPAFFDLHWKRNAKRFLGKIKNKKNKKLFIKKDQKN